MSDPGPRQRKLFEAANERSLLDQLLADSRLYTESKAYKELLDFVVRLRNFAPFNAMLLQVQKPGLKFAASAPDWRDRFGRTPKEGARPLLILWPFGPVALVYDEMDTDGEALPEDVASFFAQGSIDEQRVASFIPILSRRNIEWRWIDAGDQKAGAIRVTRRATKDGEVTTYQVNINRNHPPAVRFATLAHELGHLLLGHLGPDRLIGAPQRSELTHAQQELEAESVSYLVCGRHDVRSKSESYLSTYVDQHTTIDDLDVYQIMRAAGQAEALLGLTSRTHYDKPLSRRQ